MRTLVREAGPAMCPELVRSISSISVGSGDGSPLGAIEVVGVPWCVPPTHARPVPAQGAKPKTLSNPITKYLTPPLQQGRTERAKNESASPRWPTSG